MTDNYYYPIGPKDFASWLELFMGIIISSWFYISTYAHKNDCFSAFWELALQLYANAKKFDSEFILYITGDYCFLTFCLSGTGMTQLIRNLVLPTTLISKFQKTLGNCSK